MSVNDIIFRLHDALNRYEEPLVRSLAAEAACQQDEEEDSAREFLDEVVTLFFQLNPYRMSPQAVAELVNANPDRFTLWKRDDNPSHDRLELDGKSRKVVDTHDWPPELLKTLKCKTMEGGDRGWWDDGLTQRDIDVLLVETLGKARKSEEEGSFTLHWKNGDRVEMGQEFRVLPILAGNAPKSVLTVDSVSICDGSPRAFVYCKSTGYPIDSCEPVRESPVDTCYNLNGNDLRGFHCSKCHKGFDIKSPVYCPNCGRRVL